MKKIFITGGFGFIGTKLAEKALSKGYSVYLYDSLVYQQNYNKLIKEISKKKGAILEWTIGDTRNIELLRKSIVNFKPDFIFHFAELVGIYACNHNPQHTREINFEASKKVIDLSIELNIPTIYNSTSSVYGNQKKNKLLHENVLLSKPGDHYCNNKLKMEQYIIKKVKSHPKFKIIILRPATIWGLSPRMRIELLPNHFIYSAVAKGMIKISEPKSHRAEMDMDDMINAYFSIMAKDKWPRLIYNVGNHNISKIEVAKIIQSVVPCKIETLGDIGDTRNLRINSEAFCKDFDWKPKNDFKQTVKKVSVWMKKNIKTIEKSKYAGMINSPLEQWLKMI